MESNICHGISWLHPHPVFYSPHFFNLWLTMSLCLGLVTNHNPLVQIMQMAAPQGQCLYGSLAMGWVPIWWECAGKVCTYVCLTSIKGHVHLTLTSLSGWLISIHNTHHRHSPDLRLTQHICCWAILSLNLPPIDLCCQPLLATSCIFKLTISLANCNFGLPLH